MRVYDDRHGRRLVAAIEIVSPANKDRPESRRAFVAKVAALLQRGVCVSFVDVVTIRRFNLYADLLELVWRTDPMLVPEPPAIYAVTVRGRKPIGRPAAAGRLVLPADPRPTPAVAADLVGRRPGRDPRSGSQLRRNLPVPAHRLIDGCDSVEGSGKWGAITPQYGKCCAILPQPVQGAEGIPAGGKETAMSLFPFQR